MPIVIRIMDINISTCLDTYKQKCRFGFDDMSIIGPKGYYI